MNTNKNNYGFIPDVVEESDYIFGGNRTPEILQENGQWLSFLPMKEYQNLDGIEPFACVSFTTLNCIETIIRRKFSLDSNFSDRFLAFTSGTKEGGNSPKKVADTVRDIGIVEESLWPFEAKTFDEYYKQPPNKLFNDARLFQLKYQFNYENVPNNKDLIKQALKSSPLGVSVTAWNEKGGIYFRPEGIENNHFTTLIGYEEGKHWLVFDSYAYLDEPFKKLAWDTDFDIIKRFYVAKKPVVHETWLSRLLNDIFG